MGWIVRSWQGEEELWKVIWVYGAFLIFLSRVTVVALRLVCNVDLDNPTDAEAAFLVWLEALYCLWMLVSSWRCAFIAGWSIWGYCVRIVVILYLLLYCLFSYMDGKAIAPKEVIIKSGLLLQWQAAKWVKDKGPDYPVKPTRWLRPSP